MSNPQTLSLLRDFSDRYSPMVVKELRHGLRTRFFTVALIQYHVLLGLLMGSALLGANQEVIHALFWVLVVLLLLFIMPLRGFAALTSEVSEGTLDMLTLTNMSSLRIVYGKWAALFSQTLLVASSLLPYMVARYFFGGVELVTEVVALGITVLSSAIVTAAIVAFSTQKSVLMRLLLLSGVVIVLIPLSFFVVALVTESQSMTATFVALRRAEQVSFFGGAVAVTAYAVYLFLTLGASRFASPAENHSTVKRLVALAVMTTMGVAGCAVGYWHTDPDAAVWILIPTFVVTILVGMDLMTEAMPVVPTIVVPANGPKWRRWCGRFLYPGWSSGVLCYLLLCLAPAAIACVISERMSDADGFLVTLCLLFANVVPLTVPAWRDQPFVRWWLIQIILCVAGLLLMILVEIVDVEALAWAGVFSPVTALFGSTVAEYGDQNELLTVGAFVGGFWALIAGGMAISHLRAYRRLEVEAAQEAETRSRPIP